ncbi:MAG: hypothetical protein AAFY72_14425 [Cyanobacteria bacterium J06649_4]
MRLTTSTTIASLLLVAALTGCNSAPTGTSGSLSNDANLNSGGDSTQSEQLASGDKNAASSDSGQASGSGSTNTLPSDSKESEKVIPEPIYPALSQGEYCYSLSTKTETVDARLVVNENDSVIGDVQGTVHNEEAGYFTSYRRIGDGIIDGSNINLEVMTWIEYDQQNSQNTWKVSEAELVMDNNTLKKDSCEQVSKAFQNENGLEASDLTKGANKVRTEQVFFDAGTSSTTVSNAVVRGDRDVYTLRAEGGQTMTLDIDSIEDNAVFDLVAPSQRIIGTELEEGTFHLPDRGDYEIIVGGTRGNATYDLEISIE